MNATLPISEPTHINSDACLRERSAIEAIGPDGNNITSVAATSRHIFLLRDDGKLYIRNRDGLDSEKRLPVSLTLKGVFLSLTSTLTQYYY